MPGTVTRPIRAIDRARGSENKARQEVDGGRECGSPSSWAVVALGLAGCNANQGVNSASRTAPGVVAGPDFPGYNAYDPTKYAQTSGFYAGGGGR